MKRSTPRPSYLIQLIFGAVAAFALAGAPQSALAQHGGGGGGHAGGGGGHFGGGGGGHFSGSSGGSHAPTAGVHSGGSSGTASRPVTPAVSFPHNEPSVISHGVSPLSFKTPPTTRPAPGFTANATPIPQHVTIGFPPPGSEHGFSTITGAAGPGWRPATSIQGGKGGVLSFSGQGHEIWQDSPQAGNVRQDSSNAFLGSRSAETQRPRPFPPHRFRGGFFGPGYGYGYGAGFFPYWGFGLGFGAWCDLLWDFGCNAFGYGNGYYGPYEPDLYLQGPSSDSVDGGPDTSQDYGAYAAQNPPMDNSTDTSAKGAVVLYLNDGTSFAVTDYWVADYKLHYTTDGARENVLDLDQIDVQRTVDENAAQGVSFTLKPAPGVAPDSTPGPR
jgi:hypothetical protein